MLRASSKPEVTDPRRTRAPSYQLELEDIEVGTGDEAVAGKIVEVHYVGVSLVDRAASSTRRGTAATRSSSALGKGQVIQGWDQGVAGMKVGGRRRITIPPMLGYGKRGAGGVIGRRDAVFVVDLIAALMATVAEIMDAEPVRWPGRSIEESCGR